MSLVLVECNRAGGTEQSRKVGRKRVERQPYEACWYVVCHTVFFVVWEKNQLLLNDGSVGKDTVPY